MIEFGARWHRKPKLETRKSFYFSVSDQRMIHVMPPFSISFCFPLTTKNVFHKKNKKTNAEGYKKRGRFWPCQQLKCIPTNVQQPPANERNLAFQMIPYFMAAVELLGTAHLIWCPSSFKREIRNEIKRAERFVWHGQSNTNGNNSFQSSIHVNIKQIGCAVFMASVCLSLRLAGFV